MNWDWLWKSRKPVSPGELEEFLGGKPFNQFDSASQVLGNFLHGDDKMRTILTRILYFCGEKIAEQAEVDTLMNIIDSRNPMIIDSAARLAESLAKDMHSTIDGKLAMTSGGYACISILLDGKNQKFVGDDNKNAIFEKLAKLYAAAKIAHEHN
jgi:hypothetical protein